MSWPRRVVEAWAARTFEHPMSARWGARAPFPGDGFVFRRRTFYGPAAERKAERDQRAQLSPRAEDDDLVSSRT